VAYCDESVCVCPSAIISSELHIRSSPNISCTLPMAMARSSSGGIVIRYGFMDNIIFAQKPRLLDVAPPPQLKRSAHAALGLAVSCVVCSDTSCRPTGARNYFSGACTRGWSLWFSCRRKTALSFICRKTVLQISDSIN